MTIAYWVIAGILAAAFLGAGVFKLVTSKDGLAAKGMAWTEDFSAPAVKGIAVAEVLGAIGVIVPPAVGIAPILAPIAAIGLLITMIGAAIVHVRRKEPVVPNVVLGAISAATAVLGFMVWV